jgi:nascent polypeptide-associated complex subunit alpha
MAAPADKKDADVRVVEVDDDDDAPDLVGNDDTAKIDEDAIKNAAGGATAGKGSKRYAKAMAKMGLKPEPNVLRISIKRGRGQSLGISKPEVYRFPGTNTFVIFGEVQGEDFGAGDTSRAAAAVTGAAPPVPKASSEAATATPAAAAAGASAAAAADEEEVDAGDLGEKEIKLVMSQANVTRGKAIKALKANKGDIVNTIMELTM